MQGQFCEIEFFGGPFDGHRELTDCRPIHLAADVIWLVRESALRLLSGTEKPAGGFCTRVALYELAFELEIPRYRFVGVISGKDFLAKL